MVRLASVLHNGKTKLVAEVLVSSSKDKYDGTGSDGNEFFFCDLSSIAPHARAFLELGQQATDRAYELIAICRQQQSVESSPLHLATKECQRLSPLDPTTVSKLLCVGMNYVDHCTEQSVDIPKTPLIFGKYAINAIVGDGCPLVADDRITKELDYEVELAVVVGQPLKRFCTLEEARSAIGGYTVMHDASARDWQLHNNGGQWLLGKAVDGYAPLGPVVVTSDELTFEQAHNTPIKCRVNGETLQDSNTHQLVFKCDEILFHISKFMTLQAGDVIATGTPPGVGCFRTPPRWLRPGDVVECEIQGIGVLTTPVVGVEDTGAGGDGASSAAATTTTTTTTTTASLMTTTPTRPRLAGMTCIVTGAARGIGYGIASRLAQDGATRVAIVDLNLTACQEACSLLRTTTCSGCDFEPIVCDVSDEKAVREVWNTFAQSNGGRIDILVQAAGIVGKTNVMTADIDVDNFDDVFRVNVRGIFNGCQAMLPIMKAKGYGRIVNIASIAGKDGNAGMLAYSASKSAVIGLTKTIGKEYATAGITCNALAPAVVRTQMVDDMPEEQVKYMTDKIPMKRCGTIEEIAAMVAFMASPECSFTTGFCFDATGGRSVY